MTALASLDHLAVLRLTGPDRVGLLQGQSSNDARRVDAAHAQLTSFNNPKGRCHAVAVLAAQGEEHLLVVERSVAAALRQRLKMYILRSKAAIAPADDLALLGRHHAPAATPGAANGAAGFAATIQEGALAIRMPGDRELLIAPVARARGLADGSAAWRRADIAVGLACVTAATAERFVPLWLGLERFGAIDYKKGCYTGQEIVARTHYLGTAKQRLYRARSAAPTEPGAKVLGRSAEQVDAAWQAVGEVVMAAPDGAGHALLFAGRAAAEWALVPEAPLTEVFAFDAAPA